MKTRITLFALGSLMFLSFIMAIRSVPPATPENCKDVKGLVEQIYSPCCMDVTIRLKGDNHQYHINRGLENQEIDLTKLQALILQEEVTLKVIKTRWSPMDPSRKIAPVAAIEIQGQTIFSRMQ